MLGSCLLPSSIGSSSPSSSWPSLEAVGTPPGGLLSVGTPPGGVLSVGTPPGGLLSVGTPPGGVLSVGTPPGGALSMGSACTGLPSSATIRSQEFKGGLENHCKVMPQWLGLTTTKVGPYLEGQLSVPTCIALECGTQVCEYTLV